MAVISLPRLCFTDSVFCAYRAFTDLGIPFVRASPVIWHQGLSRLLMQAMSEDYDVAFTLDYDSVFMTSHVEAMLDIMRDCSWVDALVPMQSRRAADNEIMFRNPDPNDPALIPRADPRDPRISLIRSGHFGLTAIRLRALKDIKKPWFVGVPDEYGDWGDGTDHRFDNRPVAGVVNKLRELLLGIKHGAGVGRTDPDMYFWENWIACRKQVYLANRVRIGHMQLVTTWPDSQLNAHHVSIEQWNESEGSFR